MTSQTLKITEVLIAKVQSLPPEQQQTINSVSIISKFYLLI